MGRASERRLFGTDGIRGLADAFPLDPDTTYAIGRALGRHLSHAGAHRQVVVGQDTRESSPAIADSVAAGLKSVGVEVRSAGVITTPGIAYLARTQLFDAGIVISASHNPWTDNGIKVFGHDGYKLPDKVELEIEQKIFSYLADPEKSDLRNGTPRNGSRTLPGDAALRQAYLAWLLSQVDAAQVAKSRILVDCANGAASELASEVFRVCGVRASFINCEPSGRNINENCGALHPEVVARAVVGASADFGITFDGDADRALFASAGGKVVNGDGILLLAARELKARGALAGNQVVATTMSNMGLEIALGRHGIRMLRASVGDKYVLEEMQKSGATLGGEQSGHVIFRDGEATTGDGLLTALRLLEIIGRSGRSLADLVSELKVFPQTIKNVRVRERRPLLEIPEVARAIREAEQALDGNGRVVVRYSGTEALARVMVEAETEDRMNFFADSIAAAIQKVLGL
ncbi:MAG TPA: phosphoglucosamine mutase [Terriglobales bacterium]|nr:phosphoglucosamine mutase [Terriglobales bacterium]